MVNKKLILFLQKIGENGGYIYGGGSLAVRLYLENKEVYRYSKDIDISKISMNHINVKNQSSPIKISSELSGSGPKSQFLPGFDVQIELEKIYGREKVDVNSNEGSSQIQEISVKDGEDEITFELFFNKENEKMSIDVIEGINFQSLGKIYADKIFLLLNSFNDGMLSDENNIRHLIDLMMIPTKLNFSVKKNYQDILNHLIKRMEKEFEWSKNKKNDDSKDDQQKKDNRKKLIIYFNDVWERFKKEELLNIKDKYPFDSINDKLSKHEFILIESKKMVSQNKIKNIDEIIKGVIDGIQF